MKNATPLLFTFLTLSGAFFVGCDGKDSRSSLTENPKTPVRVQQSPIPVQRQSPNSAAETEAIQTVEQAFLDGWLMHDGSWFRLRFSKGTSSPIALYEMKGPSFFVARGELPSKAEQLNGKEWEGQINLHSEASRAFSYESSTWSKWWGGAPYNGDGWAEMPHFHLEKEAGEWRLHGIRSDNNRKPTAQEVRAALSISANQAVQ